MTLSTNLRFSVRQRQLSYSGWRKKGLIERHTSSKDARQKAVALTDKAVKIASACQSYLRKEEEEFVQQFSAEERSFSKYYNTIVIFKFIKEE